MEVLTHPHCAIVRSPKRSSLMLRALFYLYQARAACKTGLVATQPP